MQYRHASNVRVHHLSHYIAARSPFQSLEIIADMVGRECCLTCSPALVFAFLVVLLSAVGVLLDRRYLW